MKPSIPGYTFTLQKEDGTNITVFTPHVNITHMDLTEEFVCFLKACGFVFPNSDVIGIEFGQE